MDELGNDFEKEVKAELNDEQKAQFEEMVKNRRTPPDQPGQRRR